MIARPKRAKVRGPERINQNGTTGRGWTQPSEHKVRAERRGRAGEMRRRRRNRARRASVLARAASVALKKKERGR